ncbi:heme o synthase [Azospirillum doebereinerae]|uniref:heme o synthase n=1 Tax=Azospirillum doebereinerae TaxID=92933 RepID=UPI001EE4F5C1|nr:heme o synthase [Azospirillum doebereinerae]MCG5239746.1 heme o synthase [Azospirillum doebereinerae]
MTDMTNDIALGQRAPGASAGDFIELLKPRVMSLVVFTGLAGLVLAPGHIHPLIGAVAVLCIAVGAGASGAINMWYDRDIDAVMTRTAKRPIPSGRVGADEALGFGVTLSVLSTLVMGIAVNWTAAALLAMTIGFYVFVYTMGLKRRTPQNIVIGGAAGAFPPMIGWAAVTGGVELPSILLFGLIFLWTPPHFWALALFRNADYTRAGVPMMPVVAGPESTKRQMLLYTLVLLPVAAAPYFVGIAGPVYLAASSLLGLMFVGCAVRVLRATDDGPAKKMFAFSILYLFLLFALMIGERLVVGGGA